MGKKETSNNLIPFTKETASVMGRKGGRASAKKREEHRAMALSLRTLMDHYLKAPKDLEESFPKEVLKNTTIQDIALLRIVRKAVEDGDVSAMTFIRNTMGEDPKDQFNAHHTTTFSYSEREEELERLRKMAVEVSYRLKIEAETYGLHPVDREYLDSLLPKLEASKVPIELKKSIEEGESFLKALDKLHNGEVMEEEEDEEEVETTRGVWLDGPDVSKLFEIVEKAREGKDVLGDLERLQATVKATLKSYDDREEEEKPSLYNFEELDFHPLDDYDEELFSASEPYIIAHGLEKTVLSWYRDRKELLDMYTLEGLIGYYDGWAPFREYFIEKAEERGILSEVMDRAPKLSEDDEERELFLVVPSRFYNESKGGTV